MKIFRYVASILLFVLSACGNQTQAASPTATAAPATNTSVPTATSLPPTATALPPTETPSPAPTLDPTVFGAIGIGEIQAFALEPVANAIFTKVMDGLIANGAIQEYQVSHVTIFPGGNGLLAEIIYNVRTTDPTWLNDGGTQSTDNWINGNCNRFDFFTTETEYQLKNPRLCG